MKQSGFGRRSDEQNVILDGCDSDSCVAPDGLIWTETPMPWAPRIIFQIISINYVSINFLKAWQMLSSAAVWSLIVIVIMWWHAQQRLPASRPEGPSQLVRERPTPRQPAAQNLDGWLKHCLEERVTWVSLGPVQRCTLSTLSPVEFPTLPPRQHWWFGFRSVILSSIAMVRHTLTSNEQLILTWIMQEIWDKGWRWFPALELGCHSDLIFT